MDNPNTNHDVNALDIDNMLINRDIAQAINDPNTLSGSIFQQLFDIFIADHLPHLANLNTTSEASTRVTQELNLFIENQAKLVEYLVNLMLQHDKIVMQSWIELTEQALKTDNDSKNFIRVCIQCILAEKERFYQLAVLLINIRVLKQELQTMYMNLANRFSQILHSFISTIPNEIFELPQLKVRIKLHDIAVAVANAVQNEIVNNRVSIDNFDDVFKDKTKESVQKYFIDKNLSVEEQEAGVKEALEWFRANPHFQRYASSLKEAFVEAQPLIDQKKHDIEKLSVSLGEEVRFLKNKINSESNRYKDIVEERPSPARNLDIYSLRSMSSFVDDHKDNHQRQEEIYQNKQEKKIDENKASEHEYKVQHNNDNKELSDEEKELQDLDLDIGSINKKSL